MAACDWPNGMADKLFESLTSVSAGAVIHDHNVCSATVHVVPHLDPEARVIVESPNGPAVQTNEGLRRFTQIGKHDRSFYLQLVRRQLECEKVRLKHDIDGGGTVFAVGKKHGRQREVRHGPKLSQASLLPPRPPCLAGPETFGISNFDWVLLSLFKTRCHL